jgi:membrane associated rhomboid family serine protease
MGDERDSLRQQDPQAATLPPTSHESGRAIESTVARQEKLPNYPVIALVGFLAAGVSFAWWNGSNISQLVENAEIRRGQLWRLVTSVCPHSNFLHLAFNLYWLWIMGRTVERIYGHLRTAALLILFAVGSGSLEFAFAQGGIGLSGVVYGLFGLLYVLSRHDQRFRNAIDKRTETLFIAWFFICIFLTATHTFNVGNIAHGAGALLGFLLGYAVVFPSRRRLLAGGVVALVLFGFWGSTLGRPLVNFSSQGGYEEAKWGYDALIANRDQEAVRWLRDAVKYQPKQSSFWFNLGLAEQRLKNPTAALLAYERAYELEPSNPDYAEAAGKKNSTQ